MSPVPVAQARNTNIATGGSAKKTTDDRGRTTDCFSFLCRLINAMPRNGLQIRLTAPPVRPR
jgi:hypothetical protein